MGTSIQTLSGWHQRGIDQKSNYMIVACDTFDHSDYPIYVDGDEDAAREKKKEVSQQSMTRIMEVYDLSKPFEETAVREMVV